jgi:hypothetical protein
MKKVQNDYFNIDEKIESTRNEQLKESIGERIMVGIVEQLLYETMNYWRLIKAAETAKDYAEINANLMHVITSCSIAISAYKKEIIAYGLQKKNTTCLNDMMKRIIETVAMLDNSCQLPI